MALALVSGVASSFVLAWPVTTPHEPAFPPAVAVDQSPLGQITVWPSRETGVGTHLLHRRLGTALSVRTMALLLDAFEEGSEPPLPFIEANVGTENRLAVSDEMVDRWEAINIHVWPQPILGETPFDSDVLRRQGLQVSDLQGVLNVRVAEAVALFNGETAPEPEQAEALANSLGVSVEQLLLNSPDDTTLQLFLPRIKDDVLEIGRRHHTDEAGARSLIREQFALAARSDGDPQSRLDAAIHRLLRTDEA